MALELDDFGCAVGSLQEIKRYAAAEVGASADT